VRDLRQRPALPRAAAGNAGEFDDAIELLADGRIEVADLTTEVVSLRAAALSAFESLRAARTMKILIDPLG
jgi:threonine dehydrogenase-like Zn-dependent dehydrogenase